MLHQATGGGIGGEIGADEVRGILSGPVLAVDGTVSGTPGSISLSFTLKTIAFRGSFILPLARYATTSPPVNSGVRIAIGITYLFFFISDSATPFTGCALDRPGHLGDHKRGHLQLRMLPAILHQRVRHLLRRGHSNVRHDAAMDRIGQVDVQHRA